MKHFFKLAFAIIKRNLSLFLALIGVMTCAVALLSGMTTAYDNINSQVFEYVDSCNYPSLTISSSFQPKKDNYLKKLETIEGVNKASYRIQIDASCSHNASSLYSRIMSYGGDNFVNYTTVSEKQCDSKRVIAVDEDFASNAKIKLGDTLKIGFSRFSLAFTVNRILSSCESYSEKQSNVLPASVNDFGFLYIEESVLQQLGLGGFFNQIIIDADKNADLDNIKKQIQDASIFDYDSIATFEESLVYNNIVYNLTPLRSAAIGFPIIFYVLGMIVTALFIFLMVKSYQSEMGILLCLGFKNRDLTLLFGLIGFLSGFFACIFGLAGGYAVAVYGYQAFAPHFSLVFTYPTFSALGTSLAILLCLVIATFSGALSSLIVIRKMTPVEVIAKPVENASFKIENKKMPLPLKMNLLRFVRHLKTNLFSIFCLSLSFTMIYASFAFYVGRRAVVNDLFDTRMDFSALVFFSSQNESDVDNAFNGDENILEYEILDWKEATITRGDSSFTGAFVGVDNDETMLKIFGMNRNVIDNPSEGAILDFHAAETLGAEIGNRIKIGDSVIEVEAISKQDCFRLNYLPKSVFESAIDSYSLCVLVDCKDVSKLTSASTSYTNCTSVISMAKLRSSLERSAATTDTAITIMVTVSIISCVAVTTNIKAAELLDERWRVSLLRAMGDSLPRVSSSIFLSDLLKALVALPIGYGFGVGVSSFILDMMDTPNFSYPFVNAPVLFFGTSAIILGLEVVSHAFIHLRLSKMNLASELKGRE